MRWSQHASLQEGTGSNEFPKKEAVISRGRRRPSNCTAASLPSFADLFELLA